MSVCKCLWMFAKWKWIKVYSKYVRKSVENFDQKNHQKIDEKID